jgi:phospholipid N-methyltransferase
MAQTHSKIKVEYGDFQTPIDLARQICSVLASQGNVPSAIVEPTCGAGNFLVAALDTFPNADKIIGIDINIDYVNILQQKVAAYNHDINKEIFQANFFDVNWTQLLSQLSQPILVVGNPPWVTNSTLGTLQSDNLPQKSNFQGYAGLEAMTGKSNFDISEWMIIHLLEAMSSFRGTLAMLCKTSVARRVLKQVWKTHKQAHDARLYRIDAKKHFNVAVDMCLLVCQTGFPVAESNTCKVFDRLIDQDYLTIFGLEDGDLVADIQAYKKWRHLRGQGSQKWRSGIKHDLAKVMELIKLDGQYQNGLGEFCELEKTFVYPLLKGTDLVKQKSVQPRKYVIVTQKRIGEDTRIIQKVAPKTWQYLHQHQQLFQKRKSSIYKNNPPFAMFGIGDYTFASWKVAISGLHKRLRFLPVGPYQDKPVMLDDTCYFLPCKSKEDASLLAQLLNSKPAQTFLKAFIFWDAKRPITATILNRLDLTALARDAGIETGEISTLAYQSETHVQGTLFKLEE